MLTKEDIQNKCYAQLINFFSYNLRTSKEVSDRLDKCLARYEEHGVLSEEDANEIRKSIFLQLVNEGLLDDAKYVSLYIEQKLGSRKPPSKLEITKFLRNKGVSNTIIKAGLALYTPNNEIDALKTAISKKLGQKSVSELDKKEKNKLLAYLIRRGFSTATIYDVLNMYDKI